MVHGASDIDISLGFTSILILIPLVEKITNGIQNSHTENFCVSGLQTQKRISALCLTTSLSSLTMQWLRGIGASNNIAIIVGIVSIVRMVIKMICIGDS